MHVLYVHQNFPAQFGHIARHLVQKHGWKCTFVSQTPAGDVEGIRKIAYKTQGGATRQNHYCSRTFENTVWHCDGVYRAMKAHPEVRPDLIVGHSGFGSTLFLRELYRDVPIINFFEYYYRAHDPLSDMDFRKDLGWNPPEMNYLRSYCRNAMILLDLQNCDAGYTPTEFQRSRFPLEYSMKLEVIFDGVDRSVYHGHQEQFRPPIAKRTGRTICEIDIPADTRIVTYVSRGFESMRGFDIFMRSSGRQRQVVLHRRQPGGQYFACGIDCRERCRETLDPFTLGAGHQSELPQLIVGGRLNATIESSDPQRMFAPRQPLSSLGCLLTQVLDLSPFAIDLLSYGFRNHPVFGLEGDAQKLRELFAKIPPNRAPVQW